MTDKAEYHIKVINDAGVVGYIAYDKHDLAHYVSTFGYGKAFSMVKAKDYIDRNFTDQEDKLFPTRIVHEASGVNYDKPLGWVKASIVRLVAEEVEGTEVHVDARIRGEEETIEGVIARVRLNPQSATDEDKRRIKDAFTGIV